MTRKFWRRVVANRRFQLTDRSRKLRVSGRAGTGQSFVARRTYRATRRRG